MFPADTLTSVLPMLQLYGSVRRMAPVQIIHCEERPGAVLVCWEEVSNQALNFFYYIQFERYILPIILVVNMSGYFKNFVRSFHSAIVQVEEDDDELSTIECEYVLQCSRANDPDQHAASYTTVYTGPDDRCLQLPHH